MKILTLLDQLRAKDTPEAVNVRTQYMRPPLGDTEVGFVRNLTFRIAIPWHSPDPGPRGTSLGTQWNVEFEGGPVLIYGFIVRVYRNANATPGQLSEFNPDFVLLKQHILGSTVFEVIMSTGDYEWDIQQFVEKGRPIDLDFTSPNVWAGGDVSSEIDHLVDPVFLMDFPYVASGQLHFQNRYGDIYYRQDRWAGWGYNVGLIYSGEGSAQFEFLGRGSPIAGNTMTNFSPEGTVTSQGTDTAYFDVVPTSPLYRALQRAKKTVENSLIKRS